MKPILISHRGNLNGSSDFENSRENIKYLLNLGVFCEIDVWLINGDFFLGHDHPKELIRESFLENDRLFVHAKNTPALDKMLRNSKIHCFWHQKDSHVITSKGFIWQEGYHNLTDKTIVVDLSKNPDYNAKCYGICVDFYPKKS